MSNIFKMVKCKCPKCREGDIFNEKGSIFLLKMPKMNKYCEECNFKFEKETGFFFGAMFVSYALATAEMILSFVIFWYFINLTPLNVFFIIAIISIFASTLNFRISRSIWIYLFYKN